MPSFTDLEKSHAGTVLSGTSGGIEMHGVLHLSGKESELRLSSSELLPYPGDESGWFDLDLQTPAGGLVLFHHALFNNWGDQARDGRRSQSSIYPNVVVFDSGALGRNHSVKSIWFRAESLGTFFSHQNIEHHFVTGSASHAEIVRDMRRESKRGPYGKWRGPYDFNRPSEILVVHRPARILSFVVREIRYSLWWGRSQRGYGGSDIDIRSYPIANITFQKPVPLDDAIEASVEWLRYFSQIAFRRLYFEEMGATGTASRMAKYAAIYPSYFPRIRVESEVDRFSSHDVTLVRWKDRKEMAAAMSRWIELAPTRQGLRQMIDRMLDSQILFDPFADVVTICGAIENLSLAKSTRAVPTATIEAMSIEAMKTAKALGTEMTVQRLKGALSILNSPGLPPHLEALLVVSVPQLDQASTRTVIDSTRFVRNLAAHGAVQSDMLQPLAVHVRQFWLSASILFDLKTAGYPTSKDQRSTVAEQRLSWSLSQIKDIQRKSALAETS
jgi:hypothetical protein